MRQDRSTTVTIDLCVGSIELPEGTVAIPAELKLEGAGAGEAGGGDLGKLFGKLTGILGPQWMRTWQRGIGVMKEIIPLLGRLGGVAAGVAIAIGALTIGWKAFVWIIEKGMAVLRTLFNVMKRVVTTIWNMNMAVMRFLAMPLRRVLLGTVSVLRMFVGKLQEAGSWLLQIGQNFVRKAIDTFQNFEQQLANTVSVMGQFGDAAMVMREQVGAAMIEITRHSRFMASEAAQAAYAVASAGFSKLAEVVDITAASIMAAEATLTPLIQTTQYAMAAINQFGLAAAEAGRVMNVFVAAIAQSPATMTKLGQAMEYAGPIAHSFGISVEEAVAALMAFFKQGRSGSRAGTEFRIVLASMAKATDKAREILGEFGITMEQLSPGRVGLIGIVEVFEKLRDTIGQIATVESIYRAFPVRAASGLVALLQVGSREMTRMQEAITGTNRAFQMQQDQLRTLQGAWRILLSKAEELQYQFLERLSPAVVDVVKQLQKLVDWARESGIFTQAGGLLGQGLLYVVNLIKSLAAPAFELLKDAAETLIPVIRELAEVVGPLLGKWVETVFPLLVAIFAQLGRVLTQFLQQNGEAIIEWFRLFLETGLKIANWLPNALPLIKNMIDLFMEWAPVLAETVLLMLPKLLELFEKLPGALDRFIETYLPLLIKGFRLFMKLAEQLVNELLPKVLELFEALGPDIGTSMDVMFSKLGDFIDAIKSLVSNIDFLKGAFQTLMGIMDSLLGSAIPLLKAFLELEQLKILGEKFKLFFLGIIPGFGQATSELRRLLTLRSEAIEELQTLLSALGTSMPGPQGGAVRGGMVELMKVMQGTIVNRQGIPRQSQSRYPVPDPNLMLTTAYAHQAARTRGFYQIIYNVNSLEAMLTIQQKEAAKMKDDEARMLKFNQAAHVGVPPTTIRTLERRV